EPLPPVNKCTASIMIDLPAPVSPVRTVNPSLNDIDISSIIAKLRIDKSVINLDHHLINETVLYYIISLKRACIFSAFLAVQHQINHVSPLQIVPIISSQSKSSINAPIAFALPGNVFKTMKFSA